MAQQAYAIASKRHISLSMYISLLLALTAIVPLFATVGSIEIFLRPALISQASAAMESDAQRQMQLIDAYLSARFNDVQVLSESVPVKNFLEGVPNTTTAASDALYAAQRGEPNYLNWSIFNLQGAAALSYPTTPQAYGKYLIVPEVMQKMRQQAGVFMSDVFYDSTKNSAVVDLYTHVINNAGRTLGYVRASLALAFVWTNVNNGVEANSPGSYAFILDENGVRIAYTNPDASGATHPADLFKAIAPLSSSVKQRIIDENLYGNSTTPISVAADATLAAAQSGLDAQATFQLTPQGQAQNFEAARYHSQLTPWTYFILKPFSEVTSLADQQLLTIFLIVAVVLIVAVGVGLLTGRRITQPILRSVIALGKNSSSLKTLSQEEHTMASELSWMVEASDTGLQSLRYYANASGVAAERIYALSKDLQQSIDHLDARRLHNTLNEIVEAATYIERSAKSQRTTNEKMLTTLRVTTQSTDQLAERARLTDEAATQLEQIVEQLTSVVGEKQR